MSNQGTVETFDPTTRAGSLLLDDGLRLEFDSAAFARSGLRLLRLGQRVRFETADGEDDPAIVSLTIVTLSPPD